MPQSPYSFLIELLGMNVATSAQGYGLEPRVLELLLDRHAQIPEIAHPDKTTQSQN